MRKPLVLSVVVVALIAAVSVWFLSRHRVEEAVFVIVVDTLRADRLSCYGFEDHETPRIDGLAARGVVFDDAFAVGGWTVPSMGGLMTSRYPTELGLVEDFNEPGHFDVRERREQWEYTLAGGYTTLAEVMREAGYHTAAFVNQPVLNNNPGWAQGFQEYVHPIGGDTLIEREDVMRTGENIVWRDIYLADPPLVSRFVEWLPAVRNDKLFVWIHLITPHAPYKPTDDYGLPPNSHPRLLYNAEVQMADKLVGRILDVIDDAVGFDRSLIVFTSDHGEEFGEHGSSDHGHTLHSECARVPLIFAGPGVPAGRRIAGPVPLIDIMPTLAALRGIAPDALPDMEGADLAPVIASGRADRIVYTEGMLYGSTERAWVEGGYRLLWDKQGNRSMLFDINTDPGELHSLTGTRPVHADSLRGRLMALHERLVGERGRFLQSEIMDDSLSTVKERRRALNAMRALGYVND